MFNYSVNVDILFLNCTCYFKLFLLSLDFIRKPSELNIAIMKLK